MDDLAQKKPVEATRSSKAIISMKCLPHRARPEGEVGLQMS